MAMNGSALRRRRGENADYWPGFVDALATLLLVTIFLISLFAVAQYVLGTALASRNDELSGVQSRLNALAEALALEEKKNSEFATQISLLSATLEQREAEGAALRGQLEDAEKRALGLQTTLDDQITLTATEAEQVALLNAQMAALNQQIAALNQALEAAEAKDRASNAQIETLSSRLNAALAQKVQQLAQYRSKFFEELATRMGDRADIRVVGDRFVFETDVLFASGSADLSFQGRAELATIAEVIRDVGRDIPADVPWIVRVDGHTDKLPIRANFPSNWELSAARAINVVKYLEELGVPSKRLVAAGFGEYHPIDPRSTPEALARNRRIELKLDSR
jgi:chemotaxis protein MotB